MKSSTKNAARSVRDISYYRQRYKNRFFAKLISWVNDEAEREQLTRKDIADRLGKDPAQISRLLSQPSNLTLDTVSDILFAFDAEAEPPEIVRFADRREANYVHPLIARVSDAGAQVKSRGDVKALGSTEAKMDLPLVRGFIVTASAA